MQHFYSMPMFVPMCICLTISFLSSSPLFSFLSRIWTQKGEKRNSRSLQSLWQLVSLADPWESISSNRKRSSCCGTSQGTVSNWEALTSFLPRLRQVTFNFALAGLCPLALSPPTLQFGLEAAARFGSSSTTSIFGDLAWLAKWFLSTEHKKEILVRNNYMRSSFPHGQWIFILS